MQAQHRSRVDADLLREQAHTVTPHLTTHGRRRLRILGHDHIIVIIILLQLSEIPFF